MKRYKTAIIDKLELCNSSLAKMIISSFWLFKLWTGPQWRYTKLLPLNEVPISFWLKILGNDHRKLKHWETRCVLIPAKKIPLKCSIVRKTRLNLKTMIIDQKFQQWYGTIYPSLAGKKKNQSLNYSPE